LSSFLCYTKYKNKDIYFIPKLFIRKKNTKLVLSYKNKIISKGLRWPDIDLELKNNDHYIKEKIKNVEKGRLLNSR